jgi:hypothetical protein
MIELYPGASSAVEQAVRKRVAGSLPRTWKVYVGPNDGTSYTYSLGYSLIL